MAFLKRITPYAIAVLLLAVFYVPPPLGKTPYEYLRAFWLYSGHLPSVQSTPYDYLMFVVQWPFAVRAFKTCSYKPLPNKFTIHGIWPAKFNGDPLNCTGTPFCKKEMDKQLENKLKISWPNLIRKDNMGFWKDQYNKHGRCCDDIFPEFPQTKYFEMAHEMWSTYSVEAMFQAAGCTPGNSYTLTELQAAVKKKTTKNPALRCKNLKESGGAYLLVEVVICYDHDGTNVMNCSSNLSRCSKVKRILYKGQ